MNMAVCREGYKDSQFFLKAGKEYQIN